MATLLLRHGLKANLPTLRVAELGFCTDTQELYIGTSTGNKLVTATGGGDMTKAVYDSGDDGVVDNAEELGGESLSEVRDHMPKTHSELFHSAPGQNLSMNSFKLQELADPTLDKDAANKEYVDNYGGGLSSTTIKAKAYMSTMQNNIPNSTWTTVALNAVIYNPGSHFNTGQYKFVTPQDGFYFTIGQCMWYSTSVIANKIYSAGLFVNAESVPRSYENRHAAIGDYLSARTVDVLELNQDDEVFLKAWHNAGAATPDIQGHATWGPCATYMSIHIIST